MRGLREISIKYNGCDPKEQPEVAKMALLIYAGTEVEDLHDTLPVPVKPEGITTAQWTVYEKSKLKLKLYFSPKQCNDFALFELMRMKPALSESITDYAMRLRKAADKCDFTNWSAEKMINPSSPGDTIWRTQLLAPYSGCPHMVSLRGCSESRIPHMASRILQQKTTICSLIS